MLDCIMNGDCGSAYIHKCLLQTDMILIFLDFQISIFLYFWKC